MQSYIPIDIVLKIVDNMDPNDLESYFSSSKELSKLSNNPRVLKYISDRFQLPYVSSFNNLIYLIKLDMYQLGELAVKAKDMEYVKIIFPIDSITRDTIALSVGYPLLLEYFLSLHKFKSTREFMAMLGKRAINKDNIQSIDIIFNYVDRIDLGNLLIDLNRYAVLKNNLNVLKHLTNKYGKISGIYVDFLTREAFRFSDLDMVKYIISIYGKRLISDNVVQQALNVQQALKNSRKDVTDYLVDIFGKDVTSHGAFMLYIEALENKETKNAISILEKFGDIINLEKALKAAEEYNNRKVVGYLKSTI